MRFALLFLFLTLHLAVAEDAPVAAPEHIHSLTGREKRLTLDRGVLGNCRGYRELNAPALVGELKKKYDLRVDPKVASDKELLIYLLAYFEVMGAPPEKGMTLKMGESGSRLAKRNGKDLIFAPNASRDLFPKKLHQEIEKEKDPSRVTVKFNNTLFEQLTEEVSTREFVQQLLKDQFNLSIDPKDTADSVQPYAREMTHKEATMVLKQISDLPLSIAKDLKLRTIVRMRPGDKGAVAADYNKESETIRLYDKAFEEGPVQGEGTVLHEFGHALWQSMPPHYQERFTQLSWDTSVYGSPKLKKTANFVTDYARKSPEEDFAEHFSAFVNNSEWLKRMAPDKQLMLSEMFNSYYLDDSKYTAGGHDKTKAAIKSEKPDTQPPKFAGKLEDLITLRAKLIEATNEVEITCIVEKLFDDISGVSKISINLGDEKRKKNLDTLFFGPKDLTDAKQGRYEKSTKIPLSEVSPDSNIVTIAVRVHDFAENDETYLFPEKKVGVSGTSGRQERPPLDLENRLAEIKIESLPVKEGMEPAYRITLPVAPSKDIKVIDLQWELKAVPGFSPYHYLENHELRPSEDGKSLVADIFFAAHVPRSEAQLSQIGVRYNEGKEWEEQSNYVPIPKTALNVGVTIKSSAPDNLKLRADINAIELTSRTSDQPNKEGGKHFIHGRFPLQGLAGGQSAKTFVRLRSPTGKVFLALFDPMKVTNGIAEFDLALPPNPEQGEYRVESVDIDKEYSSPGKSLPGAEASMQLKSSKKLEIKALERNIERTFDLSF